MAISWLFSHVCKRSLFWLHMKQLAQWDHDLEVYFDLSFVKHAYIYMEAYTYPILLFSCSKAFDELNKRPSAANFDFFLPLSLE